MGQTGMNTILLQNVSWSTYQALLVEAGESARFTYDRGCLEIEMSPLIKHEAPKRLLEMLVELFCEEQEILFLPVGSTTFSHESQQQGAEPDSGYLLGERAEVTEDYTDRDAAQLYPDLVIEIDLTNPSVSKDGLYHTLGVREIWRWRGNQLSLWIRTATAFETTSVSKLLPGVTAQALTDFVLSGQKTTQLVWRKEVRRWARTP